jgi:hypothetical protein
MGGLTGDDGEVYNHPLYTLPQGVGIGTY